nr:hypothetical protein CcurKRNrm2_p143 [Cryptomonas curvata]
MLQHIKYIKNYNISKTKKNIVIHNIAMNLKKYTTSIFFEKINQKNGLYKFDRTYPGTAAPGLVEENVPLKNLFKYEINNLNSQEFSRDKQCGTIREADESILDWLEIRGKIKPRLQEDNKEDLTEKTQTLLEDEFDFEDGEDTLENFFSQTSSKLIDFI